MKLSQYLSKCPVGEEVTVFDTDIDIEVYFYNCKSTKWDKACFSIASKLEVKEVGCNGVTVNLSELIEHNLKNLKGLFKIYDVEEIVCDMENILAGYVSERWIEEFANRLEIVS